jgi:hypothetical protein
MKHILTALLFFAALTATSQNVVDTSLQRQYYLFDSFKTGKVLSKSGEVNEAPLNYNSYDQSIVFKKDDVIMILIGLENIDTIYLANKKFIPLNGKVYEVMQAEGKVQLYTTYSGKIVPLKATADHTGTSKQNLTEVRNTVTDAYVTRPYKGNFVIQQSQRFWLKSGDDMYRIDNARSLRKVFKDFDNPSITESIKEHHLDLENEADVVKLVKYCNSRS